MRKTSLTALFCALLFVGSVSAADTAWAKSESGKWVPSKNHEWKQLPSQAYRVPNSLAQSHIVSYVEGDWVPNGKIHAYVSHVSYNVPSYRKPASVQPVFDHPDYYDKKWYTPYRKYHVEE
jgi:hypothetical protein